jgi:protein-tyrosine-phosphatase
MAEKTVVFVCQHGAFRSRMAAAYFNAARPVGWRAVSAGLTPQSEVSTRLMPLLAGTDAASFADLDAPRPFDPAAADRVITIDEPIAGVERWRTGGTDVEVRDQIEDHVRRLLAEVQNLP